MVGPLVKEDSLAESISIEETNALRRSLGLSELSETPVSSEDSAVANFKAYMAAKTKEEETQAVLERIKRLVYYFLHF
ncbi:hypothetical protein PCK1_002498 [Pneumocystis canis]|nr:hypothetical protein PCK1_002498 [Pneumocystis canis]